MSDRSKTHQKRTAGGYTAPQVTAPPRSDVMEMLSGKVTVSDDGCWLFNGKLNADGYGSLCVGGAMVGAHRAVVMALVHPDVVKGMDVHHVCRVKNCVKPGHLVVCSRSVHNQIHAGSFDSDDWLVDRHYKGRVVETYKAQRADLVH